MAKQDRKAATTETVEPAARTRIRQTNSKDEVVRVDAYITDEEFATPVGPAEAGTSGGTDQRV